MERRHRRQPGPLAEPRRCRPSHPCCTTAPDNLKFGVYYIVSDNANMIFDRAAAEREIGFIAKDGWR